MSQSNGWATAQAPRFVSAPVQEKHVEPAKKQQEADQLRAKVEAHLARGGRYEVLPSPHKAVRAQALRSLSIGKDH